LLVAIQKEQEIDSEIQEIENDAVTHVKLFIENHIGDKLSLDKISGAVYLNPSYLSRSFKQNTGITISDYILEVRITKAKELLLNSELKVYEIAQRVGINSLEYFVRMFKKKLGISPNEYRKINYKK